MSISKALELFFCCPKVLKLMLQNKIVTQSTEKIEFYHCVIWTHKSWGTTFPRTTSSSATTGTETVSNGLIIISSTFTTNTSTATSPTAGISTSTDITLHPLLLPQLLFYLVLPLLLWLNVWFSSNKLLHAAAQFYRRQWYPDTSLRKRVMTKK